MSAWVSVEFLELQICAVGPTSSYGSCMAAENEREARGGHTMQTRPDPPVSAPRCVLRKYATTSCRQHAVIYSPLPSVIEMDLPLVVRSYCMDSREGVTDALEVRPLSDGRG